MPNSPDVDHASKRRRMYDMAEKGPAVSLVQGVSEAGGVREVKAKVGDVRMAREEIQAYSFMVDDQLISLNTEETSSQVLASLMAARDTIAGLLTLAQEGDLDKAGKELDSSKPDLVLARSKLGSARDPAKTSQEKLAQTKKELEAEKQAIQEILKRNEELAAEKEVIQYRFSDVALYFFNKGKVDAMKEPAEIRLFWNPDKEMENLNVAYPNLAELNSTEEGIMPVWRTYGPLPVTKA